MGHLLFAMLLVKYPADILACDKIANFISEISLSIPWINSSMKLIKSSFLYFSKWSSVIKKLKS